jgi:hypothetical protein
MTGVGATELGMSDQFELTSTICARPQQFAWFIGAGASAVAGLPTAWDIIWDLKRRYYCREENQDISRQDVQLATIRTRIQSYMLSKGFPDEGDPDEYALYFEKIFGDNKERQRQYLTAILSEDKVTLSVGNRVLGALLATGRTRATFTTNFDTVVERAVAEVARRSISAYHLEGTTSANKALSNEEYPFYCKLHGDFRYESVRNLSRDLVTQNQDLSKALLTAVNRFGLVVAGYSGRDESVMRLLDSALSTPNPYPHGLFWTGMKKAPVLPAVTELIEKARRAGVNAAFVEVETFDAFMLRLWRNIENKEPAIDARVKRSVQTTVAIPMPEAGRGAIVRMNALPVLTLPGECQAITFRSEKEWSELHDATVATKGQLIFTKTDVVLCWGQVALIRAHFKDVVMIATYDISTKIADIGHNLNIKGFVGEAICHALARGKPLLTRKNRAGSYLIADAHSSDQAALEPLHKVVGKTAGQIAGLYTPVDDEHPHPEKVFWAEAVRVLFDVIDGRNWLLLDPDVWIWPPRAKKDATAFLDERRSNRYNNVYNALLDGWLAVLLGTDRSTETTISACEHGTVAENPSFSIGSRTAYTRRIGS